MTALPGVRFEGVWKSYPVWPTGRRTLRAIAHRRVPLLARHGARHWALRDVSVEVEAGSSLGVIGRNGAGKSTLLRLASGLGRPTRGRVVAAPDAAAVLALGDTLNPSLTGRENALTAAFVAGWRGPVARAVVPEVLAFAELDDVADAPVRTYSEGMKLRLAFGVVAQLEPGALLLDEVMAVGDLAFQAKCMERVRAMRDGGTTLVLASHDLRLVERECDRAIWLDDGAVVASGTTAEVVAAYEEASQARTLARTPSPAEGAEGRRGGGGSALRLRENRVGTQDATIEEVVVRSRRAGAAVAPGDPLTVSLTVRSESATVLDPIAAVTVHREHDDVLCLEANTHRAGVRFGRFEEASVTLTVERLDLAPGRYLLDVALYSADWEVVYDFHWHAYGFEVVGRAGDRGVLGPPQRWEIELGGR